MPPPRRARPGPAHRANATPHRLERHRARSAAPPARRLLAWPWRTADRRSRRHVLGVGSHPVKRVPVGPVRRLHRTVIDRLDRVVKDAGGRLQKMHDAPQVVVLFGLFVHGDPAHGMARRDRHGGGQFQGFADRRANAQRQQARDGAGSAPIGREAIRVRTGRRIVDGGAPGRTTGMTDARSAHVEEAQFSRKSMKVPG
jgi:hypothetical protein